ncbi:MAG: fumarate hydratase [Oscillospiraceae bacterium]
MRTIPASQITTAVKQLCIQANLYLPKDIQTQIVDFAARDTNPLAQDILNQLVQNYTLAEQNQVPICQDTGMACVFLEIGQEVYIDGNINEAVDEGVRQGYAEGYLRKSVVADPLERINTKDNTPAMLYTEFMPGDALTITVAPKGFGSENMSQIKMLTPAAGQQGVIDFVLQTVKEAGPNPCPPMVVGVGIGGTFDKAALLAKKALLRPTTQPNPKPLYAQMEQDLLQKINGLNIGPQGYGGDTTALAVAIETMPTHIAGLPCAVNISCHVTRHASQTI